LLTPPGYRAGLVGPALRLRAELLGPEYSMQVDSLTTDLTVFLSRKIRGEAGEDLVEKQNSEQGLMPVIADEAGVYGYTAENRHMVQAFLAGREPSEPRSDLDQALDPAPHHRLGRIDAVGDVRHRQGGVPLQLLEDAHVEGVQGLGFHIVSSGALERTRVAQIIIKPEQMTYIPLNIGT